MKEHKVICVFTHGIGLVIEKKKAVREWWYDRHMGHIFLLLDYAQS